MSQSTKIDLAAASKQELLDFIEKSGTTVDPNLSKPQLREKAMEIHQSLEAMKADDDLEQRAKAASDAVLSDDEADDTDGDEGDSTEPQIITQMKESKKKSDSVDNLDSLEVHPHDGESASINEIVDNSRTGKSADLDETIEEKIMREQQQKRDDYRTAREVAAADAQIREYHLDAMDKHRAKRTDVCFFLLKGTNLNTFTTPYTRIPGVRLRKETPYRALDVELKLFRRKRRMFGECAYQGADKVGIKKK